MNPVLDCPSLGTGVCEIFLVVRPEDKAAVGRALEGEIGGGFISFPALGRGSQGGLVYEPRDRRRNWLSWLDRSPALAFLPKTVFWAVVDRRCAESVVERVSAAVRLSGGPADCAGGFAVIAAMETESPVGITPGAGRRQADFPARDGVEGAGAPYAAGGAD